MAKFPETRVSLILRLGSPSDVQAWQEFADIYAPMLYSLALSKGLQPADAEDVTQDILFGVARAIEKFEPDPQRARFRTWLSRIARNLIADFFAGRAKRPVSQILSDSWLQEVCSNLPQPTHETENFENQFYTSIFQLAARRIRHRVATASWLAFQRTVVELEPVAEVAADLGISVGNLYVARCRVLKMLREEVQALRQAYQDDELQLPDAGIGSGLTSSATNRPAPGGKHVAQ